MPKIFSYPQPYKPSPHPLLFDFCKIYFNIILPSRCLPEGLFASGFPLNPCSHFSSPPYMPYTPPVSTSLFWSPPLILGKQYKSWSSSLGSFLQSPYTSHFFEFSETLSLCSSRNVRDQVSYPYKTTGKNCRSLYTKIPLTQHPIIWKSWLTLEESRPKNGTFAFCRKSFINERGRSQGHVYKKPPRMSVNQLL